MNKILRKKTLLIAEDDYFNRLLVVSMLAKYKQLEVIEAKDGEEALAMLEKHDIDMLLLDVYMPKMNGLETLTKIRNMKKINNLPIIIVSSDETEEKKSLDLGANAFMVKPFKLKVLEEKIYTVLGESF